MIIRGIINKDGEKIYESDHPLFHHCCERFPITQEILETDVFTLLAAHGVHLSDIIFEEEPTPPTREEKMEELLRHCKMHIFENKGYCPTKREELEELSFDFKQLGF